MSDKYYIFYTGNEGGEITTADTMSQLTIILDVFKKTTFTVHGVVHGDRLAYLYGEHVGGSDE